MKINGVRAHHSAVMTSLLSIEEDVLRLRRISPSSLAPLITRASDALDAILDIFDQKRGRATVEQRAVVRLHIRRAGEGLSGARRTALDEGDGAAAALYLLEALSLLHKCNAAAHSMQVLRTNLRLVTAETGGTIRGRDASGMTAFLSQWGTRWP